jgi:hypothetical protein
MTMHLRTQERVGQMVFRLTWAMIGLTTASQFHSDVVHGLRGEQGRGSAGGGGCTKEEVLNVVREATEEMKKEIPHEIRAASARQFLEEQRRLDLAKKD